MDNITHSLFGLALGRTKKYKDASLSKTALWTSIIGSNLPDVDFLFQRVLIKGNLGYLLHHRGYTHTLLMAIPLGILSAEFAILINRLQGSHRKQLYSLGILAVIFHIGWDFCNSYGIHALSPFFERWFYGDFIFIVEPLIWFAFLPLAFQTAQSKIFKSFIAAIYIFAFFVLWTKPIIFAPAITLIATSWAILLFILQINFQNTFPSLVATLLILLCFWTTSRSARRIVKTNFLSSQHQESIKQVMTSPAPSNPFCWSTATLSTSARQEYIIRVGVVSLLPSIFPPEKCYFYSKQTPSTPLTPPTLIRVPNLYWVGEFRKPLSELVDLTSQYCHFKEFLKFSRFPSWFKISEKWIATDLRYDHGSKAGFAKINVETSELCPVHTPPWEPPLQRALKWKFF